MLHFLSDAATHHVFPEGRKEKGILIRMSQEKFIYSKYLLACNTTLIRSVSAHNYCLVIAGGNSGETRVQVLGGKNICFGQKNRLASASRVPQSLESVWCPQGLKS